MQEKCGGHNVLGQDDENPYSLVYEVAYFHHDYIRIGKKINLDV